MEQLSMNDGTIEYVSDLRDFCELADKYMGFDSRHWLEGLIEEEFEASAYAEELEKEIDGLKEYHREVIRSIRKYDEKLGELIREKELDRRKISNTVGAIGLITWRELNR